MREPERPFGRSRRTGRAHRGPRIPVWAAVLALALIVLVVWLVINMLAAESRSGETRETGMDLAPPAGQTAPAQQPAP